MERVKLDYRLIWLHVWLTITAPYLRWLLPHLGYFGAGFAVIFNCALSFQNESGPIFPDGDIGMGPSATPPEYFHTLILGAAGMVSNLVFGITFSACRKSTSGKRFLSVAAILIADSLVLGFSIQWIKYIWSESSLYNDPLVTSGLHPAGVIWWLKLFKPMRKSFLSFVILCGFSVISDLYMIWCDLRPRIEVARAETTTVEERVELSQLPAVRDIYSMEDEDLS